MNGLVIGTVKENYNQDHPGMVQVTVPALDDTGNFLKWIPVAARYAGKNYGVYLMPEKGDQVVVGFIEGDPHCGVVLGSLWNTKNTLPKNTATEENLVRALITKGGHSVTVKDGDEGAITVKSTSGHLIEIKEKDKKITVSTGNGKNKIVLDEKSINIDADDKISLKAKNISIDGKLTAKGASVSIEADGGLTLKGKQVKIDGSTLNTNGQSTKIAGASVTVESSGILTLKGSMTKIN